MMLVKSVFFYIVMSLEAFIYCFAGEHLSTKVRIQCITCVFHAGPRQRFIVHFRAK